MKVVLVCGGRDYGRIDANKPLEFPRRAAERARIAAVLDALALEVGKFELIHGGARGADSIAEGWAGKKGFPWRSFPADWENITRPGAVIKLRKKDRKPYDALAGHVRNAKMLEQKPDLVVAFPGGTGTADMIERARKAGVEVREVV